MKSLAHFAGFSLALAAAGLGSGCASSTPTATYRQPAQDFEVVESSTERALTDTEKAEVRSSVASYLDREGVSDSGDYFLKVYLTPENVDAESEWVVVRFTQYTAQRVEVVSSYPYDSLMYSSYYPYYAYDIYPYGYGCVARISFQYYVDPFYNQRHYYYPRHGHGDHKGDNHDTAHNHGDKGGKPNHTGNRSGTDANPGPIRPTGTRYTGNRTSNPPLDGGTAAPADNGTTVDPQTGDNRDNRASRYNRYDRNNPNTPVARQNPNATDGTGQPRENPRNQWRGRPGVDAGTSGVANNGNRPDRSNRVNNPNQRPPENRPANSTTASTQAPVNNPPAQWRHERKNPRQAPSGVNNPMRTEAYVSPTANRPAQAPNRSTPTHRSTPPANRPAPNYSRPTPSVQQTRSSPAPSYQQPARSAPASTSGNSNSNSNGRSNGDSRENSRGQREAMR